MELLSERSKVYDLADPRLVSAYVNQHVGNHSIAISDVRSQAMLIHRQVSELDFCRIRYGSETRVTSTSLRDKYHIQIMLNGSCLQRHAGGQRVLLAGDLVVINPEDVVDLTYSDDCEKFILKIPVGLVNTVCDVQRWGRPVGGLRFDEKVYRLTDLQTIVQLLSLVCSEIESENVIRTVQEHYIQIIIIKILTSLLTNLDIKGEGVQSQLLRKVLQHIEDNLKTDITPEALARFANLSLRSLYVLFDQHVGEPPRRYFIRRKLERIHAALQDSAGRTQSVTELAMDYGFTHLGRFSAEYKARFAELPSQTLKHRKSFLAQQSERSVVGR